MKKALVLCIAIALNVSVFSQEKITEGVITTSQKLSSDNEQMNAQLAMVGDMTTTTYFKNDKSRTEMSNPMSGNMIIITDGTAMQSITFMDNPMIGKKYKKASLDVPQDQLDKVTVKKGDKTKTILGYECQQYLISTNIEGQAMEMEVYTTEAINAYSQQTAAFSSKLKGFPLYMTMTTNQMGANLTVVSEVTDIKKEALGNDKFDMAILDGYDEMQQN